MSSSVANATALFYGSDMIGAEKILKDLLDDENEGAEAKLRFAHVAWLRAILSEWGEDATEAYKRLKTCKKSLNSKVFEEKATIGECILLEALLYLRMGSYLSGAYNLRKGWLVCQSLTQKSYKIEYDNAPKETQDKLTFIVAAFNFFVSIIPPAVQFIVSALGFEANRTAGYENLQACFESGSLISPFAGILVLWIETFFKENLDVAEEVYTKCNSRYPNNMLILYLGGYLSRQRFQVEEAKTRFAVAASVSTDLRQFKLACDYELGDCYWKLMDWDNAIKYLSAFHAENKSKSFRCFAAYQLGIAYCFNGVEEEASPWFISSTKWARKYFSFDAFAARKSKEYDSCTPKLDEIEKLFIGASNLRKQGKQSVALALLQQIDIQSIEVNQQAFYYYLTGRLQKEMGNNEIALEQFKECIGLKGFVKQEIYTIPHSLMECGDVYLRMGDKENATQSLVEAKKYKNYDFDKPNIRRIMRLLEQIEQIEEPPNSFAANE